MGNYAADLSLQDATQRTTAFPDLVKESQPAANSMAVSPSPRVWLNGFARSGPVGITGAIITLEMTDRFAAADPKQRVQWFGPDMSVRSSITARLMETWGA